MLRNHPKWAKSMDISLNFLRKGWICLPEHFYVCGLPTHLSEGWEEKLTWQGRCLFSEKGKPGNVSVFKWCVRFSLFSCQFWSFKPIVKAIFSKFSALCARRDQKLLFRSISLLENRKVIGIYLFRGGAINTSGLIINPCFWRICYFFWKP